MNKLKSKIKRMFLLKYGHITEEIKSIDAGFVSEVEYRDCNGVVIGYWAYGSFDPSLPYQGEDLEEPQRKQ